MRSTIEMYASKVKIVVTLIKYLFSFYYERYDLSSTFLNIS